MSSYSFIIYYYMRSVPDTTRKLSYRWPRDAPYTWVPCN